MSRGGMQRAAWLPPMLGNNNPISLRFLNENRAGDGGFIVRKDNRMIHSATGERFKMRGTHLTGQARFLPDDSAKNVAKTLADCGFNYIRSQGDSTLANRSSGNGDFWDLAAADYTTFDTTPGDDNFLVRWDWTREWFAQEGIYWGMMLSYNRPYPAVQRPLAYQADIWPGSNGFGFGLYAFEPLRTWHRDYWTRFLTRPSAATGVALVDDPSMMMVYLHNEEGICDTWNRSTNYFSPANFSGQLRTDMIALWDTYAQSHGAPAQGELINPLAGSWGAGAPDWTGAASVSTADGTLQHTWIRWLMELEHAAHTSDYEFLRSLGVKCIIQISTGNYISPYSNVGDTVTMHNYVSTITTGASAGSINLTRTSGSNIATTASTGAVVFGDTISTGLGFPTGSYVTNVVTNTSVTLNNAATSSGGPTASSFTHMCSGNSGSIEPLADHTMGVFVFQSASYRDLSRPYLQDEWGFRQHAMWGSTWWPYSSIIQQLQDYDGSAGFMWGGGYGYPTTSLTQSWRPITGIGDSAHDPSAVLGQMVHNLMFEKGYLSPLPNTTELTVSFNTLMQQGVVFKSLGFGTNRIVTLSGTPQLVTKIGVAYTADPAQDNLATFTLPTPASLSTNIYTINGVNGDIITYDRTQTSGNRLIWEHPKGLIFVNCLPPSYTSSVNGVTIEFPYTLTQTCNITSGSANIVVSDGTAWNLGDMVQIVGQNFLSSNKQNVAIVTNINGNTLSLITQGGNTGVVAATANQTVSGATINRVQYGVFALISLDDKPLGQGQMMLACYSSVWPESMKWFSNDEVANANLQKFPSYFDFGDSARCGIDLPVGRITMPNTVSVTSVDSEGKEMSVAKKTTSFGLVKNPLYLVTEAK